MQGFHSVSSTSTLPRLLKNKPIAKIMGGERNSMASASGTTDYCPGKGQGYVGTSDGYKSLPRDIGRKNGVPEYKENGTGQPPYAPEASGYGYERFPTTTVPPQQLNQKNPPPPPRRGSAPGESIYGPPLSTFQQPNPGGYSGWTTQFPPPPPVLSCDVPYG